MLVLVTDRVGTSEFVPLPDSSDLFDFGDTQSEDSLPDDGDDVGGFTFAVGTYAERGSRQLWYPASGTFVAGVALTVTGFDDEDFSRSGLRTLLARRRSRQAQDHAG